MRTILLYMEKAITRKIILNPATNIKHSFILTSQGIHKLSSDDRCSAIV